MKSWKDISVQALIELTQISGQEFEDPIDKQVKILALLSGKPEADILDLTREAFIKLHAEFSFVDNLPEGANIASFKCGGYKWKPNTNISKLRTEQYIDASYLLKNETEIVNNIPKLLAVYCEPYKRNALGIYRKVEIDFAEKTELLKQASVQNVYPLSVFFCLLIIRLTADMKDFLMAEAQRIAKQKKK